MVRKIVVCDDDRNALQQIELYLKHMRIEFAENLEVLYFSSGKELLRFIPEDTQILLLDISMGDMNGIEVARQLRDRGMKKLCIFFITNLPEYAMEGYEVHAFSFLAKPLQYEALYRNLEEAFHAIDQEKNAVFALNDGSSISVIQLESLLYAEVMRHDTWFVFQNGRKEHTISLSEVEKQIKNGGFFRCHRSYLVNFRHITRIDSVAVHMTNGDCIPISKYRRQEFLDAYARYARIRL